MRALVLGRKPHGESVVDLCDGCHALWLDTHESVQLTPGAIVALFREVSARRRAGASRLPARDAMPALPGLAGADAGPAPFHAIQLLAMHEGPRPLHAVRAVPAREGLHPAAHAGGARAAEGARPHDPLQRLRRARRPRARHGVQLLPRAGGSARSRRGRHDAEIARRGRGQAHDGRRRRPGGRDHRLAPASAGAARFGSPSASTPAT